MADSESLTSAESSAVNWREPKRRFGAGLKQAGKAREDREAVRSSLSTPNPLRQAPMGTPVDYEDFVNRHRNALENDPLRDLLLFPRDDIAEESRPQPQRTAVPGVSERLRAEASGTVLPRLALQTYSAPHTLLHFNYAKYAGDWTRLPRAQSSEEPLAELSYEIDLLDEENGDDATPTASDGEVLKEGVLLQVMESSGPVSFSKGQKKRWAVLRRTAGSLGGRSALELEVFKETRQGALLTNIPVERIARGSKKGRGILDLLPAGTSNNNLGKGSTPLQPLLTVGAESEGELEAWFKALSAALAAQAKEDTASVGSGAASSLAGDTESQGSSEDSRAERRAQRPPKMPRRDLFQLYADLEPDTSTSRDAQNSFLAGGGEEKKEAAEKGIRFLMSLDSLNLRLPVQRTPGGATEEAQLEPFLIRFFLWDAKANVRVSEEVHITPPTNPASAASPKKRSESSSGWSPEVRGVDEAWAADSRNRRALFYVAQPHAHIFLVARLERVLQGGGVEAYMKPDHRLSAKAEKSSSTALSKLSSYRQAFAWTARAVFSELLGKARGQTLPLFRCDPGKAAEADLAKLLQDLAKPEKAQKLPTLAGASLGISLDLSVRAEELRSRLTPSLLPVSTFAPQASTPPVLEVQHFPLSAGESGDLRPWSSYESLLFVYPAQLRFENQKLFPKARNLVAWVELRDSDSAGAKPLRAIFHRGGLAGPSGEAFVASASLAVTHHEPSPTFAAEEVKLLLPVHLTDKHHLLFSFGHVPISAATTGKESSSESPCGFAWVPLVRGKGGEVRLGLDAEESHHSLPVSASIPPGYLALKPPGAQPSNAPRMNGASAADVKWVEGGKGLLKLRLRLHSSAHTPCPKLQSFFAAAAALRKPAEAEGRDEAMCRAARGLSSVSPSRLVGFLPTVLEELLRSLQLISSEEAALEAAKALVGVVAAAVASGQEAQLRAFVRLRYHGREVDLLGQEAWGHQSLSKLLPLLLRPAHADPTTTPAFLAQAWFFLELIVKSLGQRLLASGAQKLSRGERFGAETAFRIESLVQSLVPLIVGRQRELPAETRAANVALAFFLRGALSLMDRGFVFHLLSFYAEKLDKQDSKPLRTYKQELVGILSEHEHWVPLSLPLLAGPKGILRKPSVSRTNGSPESSADVRKSSSSGLIQRLISSLTGGPAPPGVSEADLEAANLEASLGDELRLSSGYCGRHFPVGLLLQEVSASLREAREVRAPAVRCLRDLVAKHSLDPRYADRAARGRIATLYAPFLSLLLDLVGELEAALKGPSIPAAGLPPAAPTTATVPPSPAVSIRREASPSASQRELSRRGTATGESFSLRSGSGLGVEVASQASGPPSSVSPSRRSDGIPSSMSSSVATLTNGTVLGGAHSPGKRDSNPSPNSPLPPTSISAGGPRERLSMGETRDLLVTGLSIVAHLPEEILAVLWRQASMAQLHDFLRLLRLCLQVFEYHGRRVTLKKTSSRLRASKRTISLKKATGPKLPPPDLDELSAAPFSVLQESHLSQEVAFAVLQALTAFTKLNRDRLASADEESLLVLSECLELHLGLIRPSHSSNLRLHALHSLAGFVKAFTARFYGRSARPFRGKVETGDAALISALAKALLAQLASRLPEVQRATAILLQALLRGSYEAGGRSGGLGRLGSELGVALSSLIGGSGSSSAASDSPSFHRGLALLAALQSRDSKGSGHFERLLSELVGQLRGVLRATAALQEAERDPLRRAALHRQLADAYRGSNRLRQTWLDNLARLHLASPAPGFVEAAVANLLVAAIIHKEIYPDKAVDWSLFGWVSEAVEAEEGSGGTSDPAGYDEDRLCERVEVAVDLLIRGERYEALGPLYRLILPIYERQRKHAAAAEAYARLADAYNRAVALRSLGRRALATYFRVVFHGEREFPDDAGTEWIYKEPGRTSLAEATERLRARCREALGLGNIRFLSPEELGPGTCGVELSHVEPVLVTPGGEELCGEAAEEDDFALHTNLRLFRYETRLQESSSKSPGDVTGQAKRRIYLSSAEAFPTLLCRVAVGSRREVVLRPLEVALESLHAKAAQLERVLSAPGPKDLKRLQLCLQGAVSAQVNAGPLSYAEAFTASAEVARYGAEGTGRLEEAFRRLLAACEAAVATNGNLVGPDQRDYHQMLLGSFCQLHSRCVRSSLGRLEEAFRRLLAACEAAVATNGNLVGPDQRDYHQMLLGSFCQLHSRCVRSSLGRLEEAFRRLLAACEAAVATNGNLVGPDQRDYHQMLLGSFCQLHSRCVRSSLGRLEEAFRRLLAACEAAVATNGNLVGPDQRDYHQMLLGSFCQLHSRCVRSSLGRLEEAFRRLLAACEAAVATNGNLVGPDQRDYHQMLLGSFCQLHSRCVRSSLGRLEEAFRRLLAACEAAVATNGNLVGPDQRDYHQMLLGSFCQLHSRCVRSSLGRLEEAFRRLLAACEAAVATNGNLVGPDQRDYHQMLLGSFCQLHSRCVRSSLGRLEEAFRRLLAACEAAVATNGNLVGPDQRDYHQMLLGSFCQLHSRLNEVFRREMLGGAAEEETAASSVDGSSLQTSDSQRGSHIFDAISGL